VLYSVLCADHKKTAFFNGLLALPPLLHDTDLRSVVYVSREHLPIISRVEQLSSEAINLLEALVGIRQGASAQLAAKLKTLDKRDLALMMEKLVGRAKQVTEWSPPPILHALMAVVSADPDLGNVLSRLLVELPPAQIKAPMIPLIQDKSWAAEALQKWAMHPDASRPVKNAIASETKGNK